MKNIFGFKKINSIEDYKKFGKHEFFLTVVGLLTMLVIVTGSAFAWFNATVTGNNTASSVYVKSASLGITFTDGDTISLLKAIPGTSASKNFTIAADSSVNINQNYKINWVVTKNEFVKTLAGESLVDNLKYSLTSTDSAGGTHVTASNVAVPQVGTTQIGSNGVLPAGGTHSYTLTINFIETNYDQNSNQGKDFIGKLQVTSINQSAA